VLERAVPVIRVGATSVMVVAPGALVVVVSALRPLVRAIGLLVVAVLPFIAPMRDPGIAPVLAPAPRVVMVTVTVERSERLSDDAGNAVLVVVLVMDRVRERKNQRARDEEQDPERAEPAAAAHPLEARGSDHGQCGRTVQRRRLQTQYDPRATLGSPSANRVVRRGRRIGVRYFFFAPLALSPPLGRASGIRSGFDQ
jgi:hypothetical protein